MINSPATPLRHRRKDGLDGVDGPAVIDRHHTSDLPCPWLGKLRGGHDRRACDQTVDRAELRLDLGESGASSAELDTSQRTRVNAARLRRHRWKAPGNRDSTTATRMPCAAMRSAKIRPSPLAPPVTTATRTLTEWSLIVSQAPLMLNARWPAQVASSGRRGRPSARSLSANGWSPRRRRPPPGR